MRKIEILKRMLFGNEYVYSEKIKYNKQIMKNNYNEVIRLWENNKRFHNTHNGERCFILGNGPSLKEVNLKDLSNEFVFTVNNFGFVENYTDVNTNVHLWMDNSFFMLREDQKYDKRRIFESFDLICKVNPICFVPYVAYPFIKNNELDKKLNINYLVLDKYLQDQVIQNFSMDKLLYCVNTVVQVAIQIAICMGFKKIYLLGCDSTNIETIINTVLNKENKNMHAYKNDDTDRVYKDMMAKVSMTDVFYDQYMLFLGYTLLNKYCNKNKIELENIKKNTLINDIKKMNISEIL